MPSLTRLTLQQRIGDLIGDPSNQRWSTAKVQAKIEEAQERFVRDTRCLTDNTTTTVVAGTAEYSLPSDLLDIKRMAHKGRLLNREEKFDLDIMAGGTDWTDDIGSPAYYYVDLDPNNLVFGLYPIPQSGDAGANLTIEYIKIPPTLSSDSSVPLDGNSLLIPYHMALAYDAARALLLIQPDQQRLAMASTYEREYQRFVSDCTEQFRALVESQPMRMRGGRYFKGL